MSSSEDEPSFKPSLVLPLTSESTPILSLPDDLLMNCFARVSAMNYPNLSLVSKRFPSLLTSQELHETRALLGRTETCLFVCFRFSPDNKPRWFILCQKENSTEYVFSPILILNSPQALCEEQVVVVGSTIYAIGGPIKDARSSSVSVLKCGSHTWRKAPSMRIERIFATANVFDGKIYVAGGCESEDCDSSNWMEVFDPKTETWEFVSSPRADNCRIRIRKSVVIDEEIIMFGLKSVGYKSKEDKWEYIGSHYSNLGWSKISFCVIDNILYRFPKLGRIIIWYDSKSMYWKTVKGLESLPKIEGYALARLVDYSGKMVVLWEKLLPSSGDHPNKMIWCAVIELERCNNGQEIWGNVEWLDGVLTVHASYCYKPKEDRWEEVGSHDLDLRGNSYYCVIDNVLYCYGMSPRIIWYDCKRRYWMDLKGLESLPKIDGYDVARLVDYGGKMVVLWEKLLPSSGDHQNKMIWCAVIELERRDDNQIQEIWGNVEWLDGVLTVPASCGFVCAVAATM